MHYGWLLFVLKFFALYLVSCICSFICRQPLRFDAKDWTHRVALFAEKTCNVHPLPWASSAVRTPQRFPEAAVRARHQAPRSQWPSINAKMAPGFFVTFARKCRQVVYAAVAAAIGRPSGWSPVQRQRGRRERGAQGRAVQVSACLSPLCASPVALSEPGAGLSHVPGPVDASGLCGSVGDSAHI